MNTQIISTVKKILKELKKLSQPKNIETMKRFGIDAKNAYGISLPNLRKLAKQIGVNQELSLQLWKNNIHETKILAPMIGNPKLVTEKQMEKWVKDFYSWDIVDQCCSNLFDKTEYAYQKAIEWSCRSEEFVKRSGFVMMASLSVHDKKAIDQDFKQFFPLIKKEAYDERNFVKKAVNWALRQIGKRNLSLNKAAIAITHQVEKLDSKSARWIARDALRELTSENVKNRLLRIKKS